MALVKYSPLISEARGAVGDIVFSRNTYGAYVRDRVIPANPNTTSQQNVRANVATVSQAWSTLTAVQRAQWNEGAVYFERLNIFSDESKLSGYNYYVRVNLMRAFLGISLLTVPNPTLPVDSQSFTSLVANTTAGTLTATFSPNGTPAQALLLFATAPQNAGVNFVKSEYRFITRLVAGKSSPYDFATEYIAKFSALPAIGKKVFVKLYRIRVGSGNRTVDLVRSAIAV